MNLLEAEDVIKGLPDQALFQEAQAPNGQLPTYLVVSEIQRRNDMRKRFAAQQAPQATSTVKDQVLNEGIAAIQPQAMMQAPQGQMGLPQFADGGSTSIPRRMGEGVRDLNKWFYGGIWNLADKTNPLPYLGRGARDFGQGLLGIEPTHVPGPAPTHVMAQPSDAETERAVQMMTERGIRDIPTATPAPVPEEVAVDPAAAMRGAIAPFTADMNARAQQAQTAMTHYGEMLRALPRSAGREQIEALRGQFPEDTADYSELIARAEQRAAAQAAAGQQRVAELEGTAKKDALNFGLMQLGAGIASGDMGQGIANAADTALGIRQQARQEITQERRLADRMSEEAARRAEDMQIQQQAEKIMLAREKFGNDSSIAMALAEMDDRDAQRAAERLMAHAELDLKGAELGMQSGRSIMEVTAQIERNAAELQQSGDMNKRALMELVASGMRDFELPMSAAITDPTAVSRAKVQFATDLLRVFSAGMGVKINDKDMQDMLALMGGATAPAASRYRIVEE